MHTQITPTEIPTRNRMVKSNEDRHVWLRSLYPQGPPVYSAGRMRRRRSSFPSQLVTMTALNKCFASIFPGKVLIKSHLWNDWESVEWRLLTYTSPKSRLGSLTKLRKNKSMSSRSRWASQAENDPRAEAQQFLLLIIVDSVAGQDPNVRFIARQRYRPSCSSSKWYAEVVCCLVI